MKRLYHPLVQEHFQKLRQMVFLAGPRQVGKTTLAQFLEEKNRPYFYCSWDDPRAKQLIFSGPAAVAEKAGLLELASQKPIIVFDEIHKFGKWKSFLKGFFDLYGAKCHIAVTGSSKLDLFKRAGDSLMGRYFLYRIHPFTVGELLRPIPQAKLIHPPQKIAPTQLERLLHFGGFPEPYMKKNRRFSSNWKRLRQEQLIYEDIRDLSQIQELAQLDHLATLLRECAGQHVSHTSLANQVNASLPTIHRWLHTLEQFYYCFAVRPWTKNVRRALRKEPKYYLWDWTLARTPGALYENFVASHLLKAVHFWTDTGLGECTLHYLRDKEKREVDFLVAHEGVPWFLVEVKAGNHTGISKALYHFQKETSAPHAFQINFEMDFVNKSCFSSKDPIIVPATTFLSQLA